MECRIKLLVDNYVPKDGTYLLIHMDEDFRCETPLEIKYDKKGGANRNIFLWGSEKADPSVRRL